MLKLKDPNGIESEQFSQISQFKQFVLDIAKKQINEHTDLLIDYELMKEGRSFTKIRFFINKQSPKQLPIPFEDKEIDEKYIRLRANLKEIGIIREDLIFKINEKQAEFYSWWYQYKTGHIKAESPSGYLLTSLGISLSK